MPKLTKLELKTIATALASQTGLIAIAVALASENPKLFLRLQKNTRFLIEIKLTVNGFTSKLTKDQLQQLIELGDNKIEAIRLFRKFTNAGLQPSFHTVEYLRQVGILNKPTTCRTSNHHDGTHEYIYQ